MKFQHHLVMALKASPGPCVRAATWKHKAVTNVKMLLENTLFLINEKNGSCRGSWRDQVSDPILLKMLSMCAYRHYFTNVAPTMIVRYGWEKQQSPAAWILSRIFEQKSQPRARSMLGSTWVMVTKCSHSFLWWREWPSHIVIFCLKPGGP